jgi:hypothetical protein
MGVDASMFAKKAKKYLYFDREYNLKAHWDMDDMNESDFQLQDNLFQEMKDCWLSNGDVIYYLKENIELAEEVKEDCKVIWSKRLLEFVEECPDDHFFIRNSNQDMYDLYDIYTEFKLESEVKCE